MPLTSELPSLVLVCPSNWGSRILTLRTAHSPSRASSPPSDPPEVLEEVVRFGVGVEAAGQGGLEADQVGSALVGVDVVDEGKDRLAVPRVVLEGQLDDDVVLLRLEQDRARIEDFLVLIEELDEFDDPALVLKLVALGDPFVRDGDPDAPVEEGQLPEPLGQDLEAVFGHFEDFVVGPERDFRSGLLRFADLFQLRQRNAALVALDEDAAVALDLEVESLGQGVDDRDADAVEAAGDFVGLVVEFAAGVKDGHDHFGRRLMLLFVHLDGNAAAVVDDRDRIVHVDEDIDVLAEAGQGFVDGVVDDFINQVMEAVGARAPDVHRRAFPDRFEALEDFDAFGRIIFFRHWLLSR